MQIIFNNKSKESKEQLLLEEEEFIKNNWKIVYNSILKEIDEASSMGNTSVIINRYGYNCYDFNLYLKCHKFVISKLIEKGFKLSNYEFAAQALVISW